MKGLESAKVRGIGVLIVFQLFLLSDIRADNYYILSDHQNEVSDPLLKNYLEYLEDSTHQWNIKDLRDKNFYPFQKYTSSAYHPSSHYWFRLKFISTSRRYNLWFFEILHPYLNYVRLWYVKGNDTVRYQPSGTSFNFDFREFKHKNYIFPIQAISNDTVTVYFSIRNNTRPSVRIGIRPAERFTEYALNEYYLLGFFYGILLIMALYNFFIYFSTKDILYLAYVLYVFCYCLNSFKIDGLGFQYLWPYFPSLTYYIENFSPLLLIVSFYLYSCKFLVCEKYSRTLKKSVNISMALYVIFFILNYAVLQISWLSFFYLLPFGLIYISGIVTYRRGNASAMYFLMAFTFLLAGFTIFVLRGFHLIPTSIFTLYALNFGFLMEVILFSYGMGQRLKFEREKQAHADRLLIDQLKENERLKDSINRELEDKVRIRTLEVQAKNEALNEALEELQAKNEQIREFNKLLEQDNQALEQDIREINKARFMLKDLTLEEFQRIYPDEESCFKYLADIKWAKPYVCKKCGNKEYYQGKTPYARRCSKCNYDESVTSYTIFHNSKMPITTSFYLTYMVIANKDISSHALSQKLGLRQKTCWAYKKKILEIMKEKNAGKWNSKDWGKIFYS